MIVCDTLLGFGMVTFSISPSRKLVHYHIQKFHIHREFKSSVDGYETFGDDSELTFSMMKSRK
jgi:hypothetical protein